MRDFVLSRFVTHDSNPNPNPNPNPNSNPNPNPNSKPDRIHPNRGYGVVEQTDALLTQESVQLLRVNSNWGVDGDWQGKYSDSWDGWTTDLLSKLPDTRGKAQGLNP